MAMSEAKKRANAKYQAGKIASLACRVKIPEAEAFKEYCQSKGKTSNAVLRDFVLSCIGDLHAQAQASTAPLGESSGAAHAD